MQYIFIDESGVNKQEGRSSVALVYISVKNVDAFNQAVLQAERILGIRPFHWSHSTWDVRARFIESISKQDFSVKIVLVRNPFREQTAYTFALGLLAGESDIFSIVIDGKKSKAYEGKIKKILRDKGIPARNLKVANDKGYPALRVADACAGIARYRYEHPEDTRINNLYERISRKITDILEE